jgi:Ca-activated chloride channel family protein
MKMRVCVMSPLLALGLTLAVAQPASANEATLVVLDASGSMWGQIEGRPKLEIARETLAGALAALPAEAEIGLMAYGHRRRGDCGDIELVVPPSADSADAINAAARDMKFQGMTPLTESVRRAAVALRHTERAARVVLITDGVETCDADPCALGDELAASGVDFTAHVVGFGLSEQEGRQVACLAENTGGRYLQANDVAALQAALQQTLVEAPPPPPKPVPEAALEAPAQAAIASTIEIRWQGPGDARDDVQLFDPSAANGAGRVLRSQRLNQDRGFDARSARLVMAAEPGRYELRYWHGELQRVLARQPIELVAAEVSLDAPAQVPIGSTFVVRWQGPGADRDDVQIAAAGDAQVIRRQRLNQDRGFDRQEASLQAPTVPGRYVLRYYNGQNDEVLAERAFEVVAAEVSLEAPAEVDMGRPFTVRWRGPGAGRDDLQITAAGDSRVIRRQRLNQDRGYDDREASITAPIAPGSYTLRYYSGTDDRVLVERAFSVRAIPVDLQAPDSVPAGQRFTLRWQGPGAVRDDVQIVEAGGDTVVRRQRLNQDRGFASNEVSLVAPEQPGDYRLRYWNGESSTGLIERPLRVE